MNFAGTLGHHVIRFHLQRQRASKNAVKVHASCCQQSLQFCEPIKMDAKQLHSSSTWWIFANESSSPFLRLFLVGRTKLVFDFWIPIVMSELATLADLFEQMNSLHFHLLALSMLISYRTQSDIGSFFFCKFICFLCSYGHRQWTFYCRIQRAQMMMVTVEGGRRDDGMQAIPSNSLLFFAEHDFGFCKYCQFSW